MTASESWCHRSSSLRNVSYIVRSSRCSSVSLVLKISLKISESLCIRNSLYENVSKIARSLRHFSVSLDKRGQYS